MYRWKFRIAFLFSAFISFFAPAQSENISLLAHWFEDSLVSNSTRVRFSDCYGFLRGGREYAVIGSTEGTHVFELTATNDLVPKGFVRGRFSHHSVSHRDYAVFRNFLYAVCDEGVSDLQIIDLSYLPDSIHLAKEDSAQFGRVHNIFIDTLNETLYSCIHRSTVSTQTIAAPLKVFSLADPLDPVELWSGPEDIAEVHDIYVRDGKAFLNCGYDGLRMYDFSPDPSDPDYLYSGTFYIDQGYNHQGWLTPSGNVYVFADETNGKRVKKCSVDGDNLAIHSYFGTNYQNGSVPHNIVCTDTFAYVAYYNEGLRIFDLRQDPPPEVAHYDTYPEENPFQMNGNWGVFLLPSGRILASDRQYGLFVLGFRSDILGVAVDDEAFTIYPNPVTKGGNAVVRIPEDISVADWLLFDGTGRHIRSGSVVDSSYFTVDGGLSAGVYYLKVSYTDYLGDSKSETLRLVVE
jgi:choice-of-anchor B domain-containing protein